MITSSDPDVFAAELPGPAILPRLDWPGNNNPKDRPRDELSQKAIHGTNVFALLCLVFFAFMCLLILYDKNDVGNDCISMCFLIKHTLRGSIHGRIAVILT